MFARGSRVLWWVALAVAVVVQLWGLYWPTQLGPTLPYNLDKVVHATMFGLVAFTACGVGWSWRGVLSILLLHAGLSEIIQAEALPNRSGDPRDALADIVGTLIGIGVFQRCWRGRRAERDTAAALAK